MWDFNYNSVGVVLNTTHNNILLVDDDNFKTYDEGDNIIRSI